MFLTVGPLLLAGYVGYICRGRPQPRMTERQLQELQILSSLEPARTPGHPRAVALNPRHSLESE